MTTRGGFRRHELTLGDGSRLVLGRDGTIRSIGSDGAVTGTCRAGDPEWESQVRRFGVQPPTTTVTPRRQNAVVGGIRP